MRLSGMVGIVFLSIFASSVCANKAEDHNGFYYLSSINPVGMRDVADSKGKVFFNKAEAYESCGIDLSSRKICLAGSFLSNDRPIFGTKEDQWFSMANVVAFKDLKPVAGEEWPIKYLEEEVPGDPNWGEKPYTDRYIFQRNGSGEFKSGYSGKSHEIVSKADRDRGIYFVWVCDESQERKSTCGGVEHLPVLVFSYIDGCFEKLNSKSSVALLKKIETFRSSLEFDSKIKKIERK